MKKIESSYIIKQESLIEFYYYKINALRISEESYNATFFSLFRYHKFSSQFSQLINLS